MIITEIKPSKQHLNCLCLENGDRIYLDKDICLECGLKEGFDLEQSALEQLRQESDYKRAKSRALWYLDRMDYSERALFEKLVSKGFSKKACSRVLANLVEFGLVDDRRYAERLAEKLMNSGNSKRSAYQKMLLKGVGGDLAKEMLSEFEESEIPQIVEIIEKKYAAKLQGENGYQRVYAALVRKGFSYSDVKTALKKYTEKSED